MCGFYLIVTFNPLTDGFIDYVTVREKVRERQEEQKQIMRDRLTCLYSSVDIRFLCNSHVLTDRHLRTHLQTAFIQSKACAPLCALIQR